MVAVVSLFAAVDFVGAYLLESELNGTAENWLAVWHVNGKHSYDSVKCLTLSTMTR